MTPRVYEVVIDGPSDSRKILCTFDQLRHLVTEDAKAAIGSMVACDTLTDVSHGDCAAFWNAALARYGLEAVDVREVAILRVTFSRAFFALAELFLYGQTLPTQTRGH